MNQPAPIVLFVYNRPDHTRRTLESLARNPLATRSILYIYADGPKDNASPEERARIAQTRAVVNKQKWCGTVHIIPADHNKGLADSIVGGVTEVVGRHGTVIVLEDDLVLSPGFLQYMNDALARYADQARVMHISGYMFPVAGNLPETLFLNQASCWGWATWKRAWEHFNPDTKNLLEKIQNRGNMARFTLDNTNTFLHQLEANARGTLKTWAIKWNTSVYLRDGLCLHPGRSLVQNIGNDGTGIHCTTTTAYEIPQLAHDIHVAEIALQESGIGRKSMVAYYKRIHTAPLPEKIRRWIKKVARWLTQ